MNENETGGWEWFNVDRLSWLNFFVLGLVPLPVLIYFVTSFDCRFARAAYVFAIVKSRTVTSLLVNWAENSLM